MPQCSKCFGVTGPMYARDYGACVVCGAPFDGTPPTVGDLLGVDDNGDPRPYENLTDARDRYFKEVLEPHAEKCDFSHRRSLLEEATKLTTGDRNVSYGDPIEDFRKTAAIWTAQLSGKLREGVSLEPHDVAALMMGLKLSRINSDPSKRDSWVDAAGYAACGFECVEIEGGAK